MKQLLKLFLLFLSTLCITSCSRCREPNTVDLEMLHGTWEVITCNGEVSDKKLSYTFTENEFLTRLTSDEMTQTIYKNTFSKGPNRELILFNADIKDGSLNIDELSINNLIFTERIFDTENNTWIVTVWVCKRKSINENKSILNM